MIRRRGVREPCQELDELLERDYEESGGSASSSAKDPGDTDLGSERDPS